MSQQTPLFGRRILIVEDEFSAAEALAFLLEATGASICGPIGELGTAIAFVERADDDVDAALLDVNLRGEKSYGLIDLLSARGIPVLLTTGYAASAIDERYRDVPVFQKPVDYQLLVAALGRLFGDAPTVGGAPAPRRPAAIDRTT